MDAGQFELLARLHQRLRQRFRRHARAGAAEQAGARHRRERNGHLQLGVIVAARLLERIRPAMVEHILAVAVGLRIHRRGGDQRAGAVPQRRVLRQPPGARPGRPAILYRGKKGVADERVVVTGAGIPFGGADAGNGRMQGKGKGRRAIGHAARYGSAASSRQEEMRPFSRWRTCPRLRLPRCPAGTAPQSSSGHGGQPRRTPLPPGRTRRSSPGRAG